MGRQLSVFCVVFSLSFCLPPPHLYLSQTQNVVVQEETPSRDSLSVRTIRQKSVGVVCPLLTLCSQHLPALPAQPKLLVGWFEIIPLLFFPTSLPSPCPFLELEV